MKRPWMTAAGHEVPGAPPAPVPPGGTDFGKGSAADERERRQRKRDDRKLFLLEALRGTAFTAGIIGSIFLCQWIAGLIA